MASPTRCLGKRDPIDLSNARLHKLAAALGPAYMRIAEPGPIRSIFTMRTRRRRPPRRTVSRACWRAPREGVIDFARRVGAMLVTSFTISSGVRDADSIWTPEQARKLLACTKTAGNDLAATELFNDPTCRSMAGRSLATVPGLRA